jgi:multicomponent Na+:H+ antiporter subunit B
VVAFIFLYGVYIVAFGHLTPGGGFAGGVILASAFVLEVLAWGKVRALEDLPFAAAKKLDTVGAFAFLALALLGLVLSGAFFLNVIQRHYPGEPLRLFSAGIIPLCNVAIGLKVCSSLLLAAVVLSAVRLTAGGGEHGFQSEEDE